MFSRVALIARHLTRPSLNFAAAASSTSFKPPAAVGFRGNMASSATAEERNSRLIHTAACLIIGDEVLGGKTVDTNSAYMAKWCFSLGIVSNPLTNCIQASLNSSILKNLKRVEVIEDDESEIVEAVRRMSDRYDFIVTSGGIGPTHDDITYSSIAKAFNLPLKLNQKAFEKMKLISKPRKDQPTFSWDEDTPALRARLRMVELPTDESRDLDKQFLFPREDLWVPVVVANGNVHILPGIPRLFEGLLDGLKPYVIPRLTDPEGKGITRVMISTPLPESAVAGYLTDLAARVQSHGVKVGSYPRWGKQHNTVTLVGRDAAFLESLVPEVVQNVQGRRVKIEGEDEVEEVSTQS